MAKGPKVTKIMRLFAAIDVSDETRAQLGRVRETLEREIDRADRPPRVAWVRDDAAHVTVRFIGEVTEATGQRVCAALAEPIPIEGFELEFRGVGVFPNSRRPRVVWIGAARGADAAALVAESVNRRLDPIVGPADDRAYRAHLTVGRVKEPGRGFDWDRTLAAVHHGSSRSAIDHVTLYQSRTSPEGPTYTALCLCSLQP